MRATIGTFFLLAVVSTLAGPAQAARNILLIIADDYGIDATRYYPLTDRRSTTPPAPLTPKLASLAQRGLLFRNVWAQPLCSPTRATILTGRYGFRTGFGRVIPQDLSKPGPVLSTTEFTLPEAFRARPALNYYLAHVGKWHLGRDIKSPNVHGWPNFVGPHPNLAAIESYYSWPKVRNGVQTTSNVYATTDQVNETLAAIATAGKLKRPFFITLALSAPHHSYHKPPNNLHTRDSLPIDDTPDSSLRRSYYEAMIEAMDTELGRLLAGVNLSTTTVILVGDNGTPYETTASPYDPNHAKDRVYEQGVHVPMIVAGSGVAAPGRMVDGLVNTVDLYPTILRLAGIDPATVLPAGRKIDGVSILPFINSTSTASLRPWVYAEKFDPAWNQSFQRAIRDRRYKLIERASASSTWGWPAREFFDLQNDPYEKTNLLQRTLTTTERSRLDYLNAELDRLLATR
jgi:arylsulfatase A-like enzyme